jgi:hypothetical protein
MKVRASVKKDLRQVQGHPPQRRGAGDLRKFETQATPGIRVGKQEEQENYGTYCRRRSSAQQARNIALTYIYGIGNPRAGRILDRGQGRSHEEGPGPQRRRGQPHPSGHRAEGLVEGDLRKEVSMNIKRLIEIGSYRGYPSPPQPAGPRPAHAHQCPHPQRSAQGNGRTRRRRRRQRHRSLLALKLWPLA